MKNTYKKLREFLNKYPGGIAWRTKKHCRVLDTHINEDEDILYCFAGQKNDSFTNIFQTCVVCLTNKRILIGQKGILWGYHLNSITPDLFNDMEVHQELIWGRVVIDTIKEVGAYGAGYKILDDEFSSTLRELSFAGYGIFFISHSKDKVLTNDRGEEYTQINPALPDRPFNIVNKMVDNDVAKFHLFYKALDGIPS